MAKGSRKSSRQYWRREVEPQVVDPNYLTMSYLSRERWISFWYQIMEVMEFFKHRTFTGTVLEVGPGPGLAIGVIREALLRQGLRGQVGVTVDIEARLNPDVVGDVIRLPFQDNSFDVILAAEVLEHIPLAEVPQALAELARVARRGLVITLPHFSRFSPSIALKIFPFVPRVQKVWPISIFPPKHQFDGQHYWEIGKRETPLSRIKELLVTQTKMKLTRDYLILENPGHHVFVLIQLFS